MGFSTKRMVRRQTPQIPLTSRVRPKYHREFDLPVSWTGSFGLILALLVLTAAGCSSAPKGMTGARQSFSMGQFEAAEKAITVIAKKPSLRDAAELDLATIEFAAGDFASAETRLRNCRDRFDALPRSSLVRDVVSLATDDNVRPFKPAGYEEVMVRTMLSLCSLAGDGVDAESYALQAMTKQNSLHRERVDAGILEASVPYQPVAIAPYIRGVLREATHHDYDDASSAYKLVSSVNPSFLPANEDLDRATHGVHSQPGHGVLYVIGWIGRGPVLVETDAPTTTTAMQIASMIVNTETNNVETGNNDQPGLPALPNLASVKVPRVIVPPSAITAIGVGVDGHFDGATQTITDVGGLAIKQNEAEMPWTIGRAIARRAFKEAAVAKMTDSVGLEGNAGMLFHFATTSAWSATESADTRCWGLLPREFQVLRAELPAGEHTVTFEPLGPKGGSLTHPTFANVTITDARNTYVFAIAPQAKIHIAGLRQR